MIFFAIPHHNNDFSYSIVAFACAIVAFIFLTNETSGIKLPSATTEFRYCCQTKQLLVLFAVGKAHQKQAELTRKLELAKRQQLLKSVLTGNVTSSTKSFVTDPTQGTSTVTANKRLEMERSEFSLLLAQYKPPIDTQDSHRSSQIPLELKTKKTLPKVTPPKKAQTKKDSPTEATVAPSSIDDNVPLQVGEKAKRVHFESLIDVLTRQPLGSMGAAKLVPWVPPYIHRNIIIVADPRKQSSELRTALQYLESNQQQKENLTNIVAITADTSDEMMAYVRCII